MTSPSTADSRRPRHAVDVSVLMEHVSERAALRARGQSPDGLRQTVAVRPEYLRSLAPGVGPAVTAAKKFVVRLQYHYLNDLAQQLSAALHQARRERRLLTREIEMLRAEVGHLERRVPPA